MLAIFTNMRESLEDSDMVRHRIGSEMVKAKSTSWKKKNGGQRKEMVSIAQIENNLSPRAIIWSAVPLPY
mgnify:CR=1 FL=1